MGKLQEGVGAVRAFVSDVVAEMRKTSWPGRQELFESTVVVIVSLLILAAFVGLSDKVLLTFLRLIIPSG
jgi:preprotein translocase subunit SecE